MRALLVIDVQKGFDDARWGPRNNHDAEKNAARLLTRWRDRREPIFHFQHLSTDPRSPLYPTGSGCVIKDEATPLSGERVFTKRTNSCFIGTSLEQELRNLGVNDLVLCGLTTDHCVSTTARMAANLGFSVVVVADATATFDRKGPDQKLYPAQVMHDTALASLCGEFAKVTTTDDVLSGREF